MKKIVLNILAVMVIGVLMTGCGSSYDGNSKKVKKTVCDIARQEFAKYLTDEAMSKITLNLKNIRTDKVDKDVKKSYNSADLEVINAGTNKTDVIPINYTAQTTDDGVYVEVRGLR